MEIMNRIISHIKKLDWWIIISALLLAFFGLLSIYSSSLGEKDFLNFKKQIIFLVVGFFLMIFLSFVDWRIFRENPYLILFLYFFSVLALAGLFFFAPAIRGVKSWYKFGSFAFDPREFAKIVLIILLAKYFSMRHVEMYKIRHIILSAFYVALPTVLIFFQPDFGSTIVLAALWFGILIVSGIKMRHFFILILCAVIFLTLSWNFLLKDYQKERVMSFLFPQTEPLGASWSQNQSKIAIGSGGIWGQGFGMGSQTQYGFLSEPQTDFIFAAISEEFGLAGAIVIFLLFGILLKRIIKIAISAESNFPRLFAIGLGIIMLSHLIIHIGMNLGILPVIGLPLMLVSYGGSGLIAAYIGLGIIQSIKTH